MRKFRFIVGIISLSALFTGQLSADFIMTLDSDDFGSITRLSGNSHTHDSNLAEAERIGNQTRSYYTFDLSAVVGSIVDARLSFENPLSIGSYRIVIRDITSDINTLTTLPTGPANYRAYYRDLGNGVRYRASTTAANINLNNALPDLNTAVNTDGLFAFGVRTSVDGTSFISDNAQLTLTVAPEPHEYLLIILGLGFVLFLRSRQIELSPA